MRSAGNAARRGPGTFRTTSSRHERTNWSEIADGGELFNSLVLCHHLPFEGTFCQEGRCFRIGEIEHPIRIAHQPTLVCIPMLDLTLRVLRDAAMIDPVAAEASLGDAHALLIGFAADPARSLGDWAAGISPLAGRLSWRPQRSLPVADAPRRDGGIAATATKERIRTIWTMVLGRDRLGLDDNLFDLGARSIKVEQIFSRLPAEGYAGLSLIDMFENPTIALLAAKIDGVAPRSMATSAPTGTGQTATEEDDAATRPEKAAQNRARRRAARS